MDIPDFVNDIPPPSNMGDLGGYLVEEDLSAPIDTFFQSVNRALKYGDQQRLLESDLIGRLLVLSLVSSAEAYIRAVLSIYIEFCPVSRSHAAKQSINLGGLLWHGKEGFSRSAFEHASFASKKDIQDTFRKFADISLDDALFKVPLEEFEKICQLRHGIVHGDGLLPGRNAVILDIPAYGKPVRIVIRFKQLQEVAAVVSTFIVMLNRFLFDQITKRWAIDWRQRADWVPSEEVRKFRMIWKSFHSTEEHKNRRGRTKISMSACMETVKANYNI